MYVGTPVHTKEKQTNLNASMAAKIKVEFGRMTNLGINHGAYKKK